MTARSHAPVLAPVGAGLVVLAFSLSLLGCDPCDPERCGTAAVLLTIRDAETGASLYDATVEFVDHPEENVSVFPGCVVSGDTCTHELSGFPVEDRHLSEGGGVGHGGLRPGVTVPFTIRVSLAGYGTRDVPIEIRANDCGLPIPRHYTIDLVAPEQGDGPPATWVAAPHC